MMSDNSNETCEDGKKTKGRFTFCKTSQEQPPQSLGSEEGIVTMEDWGKVSLFDVSKFFKTNEKDSNESSVLEIQLPSTDSMDSTDFSGYTSSLYPHLDESSSRYPPSDGPVGVAVDDLENLGENEEKLHTLHLYRSCKNIVRWQWSKIVGLGFVIGGLVLGVISATIHAATRGAHLGHGQDSSIFGRQFRMIINVRTEMVDSDTPNEFKTWRSSLGDDWNLVFSDEFNCENRTFYPGDDQLWEAVDIHYAATNNMEWLDPSHVTTKEGALRITMDNKTSHNLNYTSGMVQSWNKLCFTQGYVETSVRMPGTRNSVGLWPAFWALGNLARAGYMASTEGTWPYSYETCDVGVTANQSSADGLSFLPGQKLNSCICKGEDHPNPGTARSAPEIDIMEGLYDNYAQTFNIAPFDIWRYPDYEHIAISNSSTSAMNSFMGTPYQEAISAVVSSNPDWYDKGSFIKFGMEYRSDMKNRMDNYINFYVNDVMTFRITEGAFHPEGNINWRIIPKEPMSLVMNLGLSKSWSEVHLDTIDFPVYMDVDYVRIFQPKGAESLTCDPKNYPTYDYIKEHYNAYSDANLTSWKKAGYEFPKYSLDGQCPRK
ncbi:hypothetical protein PMKS-001612 [Pichia membranifaciens]|uniref:GH16 domain-containing protein n=1 Tax=Pichia membranifaciens TaxID=4926 RepID=A0A1Q2YFI1_9ASCO|nr:hypothetical protein PMKS-001612 [Pichia membranifaciens]